MKMEDKFFTKVGEIEKQSLLDLASEQRETTDGKDSLDAQLNCTENYPKGETHVKPSDSQTDHLPSSGNVESSTSPTIVHVAAQRSSNNVSSNETVGFVKALDPLESNSSNESSCVSSPLFENSISECGSRPMSPFNVDIVAMEYNKLKERYQSLQDEYQTSLEREKVLCERLKEYGGQDDESCNALTNINTELRKELDFVLGELQKLRSENKK